MSLRLRSTAFGVSLLILSACASSEPVRQKVGQEATDAVETAFAAFERVCLANLDNLSRFDRRPVHAVMREVAQEGSGWRGSALAGLDGPVAKLVHDANGVDLTVTAVSDKASCQASLGGAPLTGIMQRVADKLAAQNRTLTPKENPSSYAISGYDGLIADYSESTKERAAAGKKLGFGVFFAVPE